MKEELSEFERLNICGSSQKSEQIKYEEVGDSIMQSEEQGSSEEYVKIDTRRAGRPENPLKIVNEDVKRKFNHIISTQFQPIEDFHHLRSDVLRKTVF